MKAKSALRPFLAAIGCATLAISSASGQNTYTWANTNITATPTSPFDWLTGGPNTQGTWTGGTPVSSNLNTVQFFDNAWTSLTHTGNPSSQTANLNNGGSAFQLGTLTLSGRASATNNAKLNMTISGDALNFSASTGTINLDATNVDGDQLITYNLDSAIQLGTASSASALTIQGNGTSAFNIGGIISELQLGGGSLVKSGTSTVSLTNANTYTGTTTLNAGTVNLSGAAGALASTAINLNGGSLTLTNATGQSAVDRISNSAIITANGGTITWTNPSGDNTANWAENIGTLSLSSGQTNIVSTNAVNAARSQILTLGSGSLTHAASNTSVLTFSGTSLGTTADDNNIVITSQADTAANQIIGPWATYGTTTANQTDYAAYNITGGVANTRGIQGAGIGASAESTWSGSHAATSNYTMSAIDSGTISGGGRNLNSLRSLNNSITVTASNPNITVTGHTLAVGDLVTFSATTMPTGLAAGTPYYVVSTAANTIQVSATKGGGAITPTSAGNTVVAAGGIQVSSGNNLGTFGILNASGTRLNILQDGGAGSVTLPTATAGNLYLTTHGVSTGTTGEHVGITVTAPINDNGANALTLVKSGVGVLQLNATSNYSGGTVLNSGTLWAQTDASLGEVNGDITFNGSATLLLSPNNGTSALNFTLPSTRSITVNNGAMATIAGGRANAVVTINGDISGSGGVTVGRVSLLSNGGIGVPNYNFNLLGSNTFTRAFNVGTGLETSAGGGIGGVTINSLADSTSPITLNYGSGAFFSLGSTASANLSVPNRPIDVINSNIVIRNQDADNTMTFGSVSTTTAGAKTFKLGDGGAGGFVTGNITNGAGTIGVEKSGTGTWTLSGANSYTGATTISNGTLSINSIDDVGGGNSAIGNPSSVTNGRILMGDRTTTGTLLYTGAAASSDRTIQINSTVSNETGGATITNNGSGALTFTATTFNNAYTIANTIVRPLTLNGNNGGTIQGVIQNNSATNSVSVTKSGTGRWILTGANTYTGNTTINGGVLQATDGVSLPSGSGILQLRGGVFQSSGTFTRNVNATAGAGGVNWATSSGGFAAIGGTLTLNLDGGTGSLTWNGSSMVSTGQTLIFGSTTADSLVDWQNGLKLAASGNNNLNRTIQVNDNSGSTTDIARISGAITSDSLNNGIIKTGDGVLQLTSSNTYTGATTINAGTLVITGATQATNAITFGGGVLGLNIASPVTATSATIDFTGQQVLVSGTPTLPSYTLLTASSITGTPTLASPVPGYTLATDGTTLKLNSTGGASPYETWAGPGVNFGDDANGDGVSNGLAFLLGAADVDENALGRLPDVEEDGSGNLVLNFTCLDEASRGTATLYVEHSGDLGIGDPWQASVAVDDDGNVLANGVTLNVTVNGGDADLNDVEATIDASGAVGGKLFGRLKATE